ncbi:response regulator transcription factor [Stieleria varia]|uniref:Response regulator protein TmoT n=1 Tax=Stieleria varia TaxID=2528005 RepID=A0A5C6A5V4_9BACT|nr:Response regulator protein TmoT [Stieleria varia]
MQSDLLTIVVVEDDPSMRRAIERVLRTGGYKPILFDSAEATLESGVLFRADCLVLDVNLPGMSGFELLEHLIPNGGSLPTIFITSHDAPAFRDRAASLGACSYHPKPFLGRVLLNAVQEAFQAK